MTTYECARCHQRVEVMVGVVSVIHICPVVQSGDRYREMKELVQ